MSWSAIISQRAMEIVQDYEIKEGRIPEDFSHKGVGYDINSVNQSRGEERHIEVKGVSEQWSTYTWQSLHHTQIEDLQNNPEKFWLYIIRFDISKEKRNKVDILKEKPEVYIIPGKDLLDKNKFRLNPESYSLRAVLRTSLKEKLQEYKK